MIACERGCRRTLPRDSVEAIEAGWVWLLTENAWVCPRCLTKHEIAAAGYATRLATAEELLQLAAHCADPEKEAELRRAAGRLHSDAQLRRAELQRLGLCDPRDIGG